MRTSRDDLLERAIEALQEGQTGKSASSHLAGAVDLHEELAIARALSSLAADVPLPSISATESAWLRLQDEVVTRSISASPHPGRSGLSRLRYAVSGIAAVLLLLTAGVAFFVAGDNEARAAVFEGVVVGAAHGSLTVQTVDGLRGLPVSPSASIADASGTAIALDTIQAGDVVQVSVHPGPDDQSAVVAAIALIDATFENWCVIEPGRCAALSHGFEDSVRSCEARPDSCGSDRERLRSLRTRARDAAMLEQLVSRCRAGETSACRDLVAFCESHAALCPADWAVPQSIETPSRTAAPNATATHDAIGTPITRVTPARSELPPAARPESTPAPRPTPTPQTRPHLTPASSPVGSMSPGDQRPTPMLTPTETPSLAPRDDAGGDVRPR